MEDRWFERRIREKILARMGKPSLKGDLARRRPLFMNLLMALQHSLGIISIEKTQLIKKIHLLKRLTSLVWNFVRQNRHTRYDSTRSSSGCWCAPAQQDRSSCSTCLYRAGMAMLVVSHRKSLLCLIGQQSNGITSTCLQLSVQGLKQKRKKEKQTSCVAQPYYATLEYTRF